MQEEQAVFLIYRQDSEGACLNKTSKEGMSLLLYNNIII